MSNLPSEILHNIFIQVSFEERLNCMQVCRCWYNTLSKRSLLYDVDIIDNEMLYKFIDMLLRQGSRRSQVEILTLESDCTFDKRVLYNLLPNLRVFTVQITNGRNLNYCSRPFEPENLNSKLESITDGGECELTRQLLKFHSCPRLKHLNVWFSLIGNPQNEVFVYLKNAPVLKELHLTFGSIGIEDMEIIHKNTPVLKTLLLSDVTLIAGRLPCKIKQANSVTSLSIKIRRVEDYPDYPDWYKYMSKKYTNLTSFDCYDYMMLNIDPNQMMKIYQDGLIPLYKNNIGIHLDYFFATNIPDELHIFNTFDDLGLQIPKFYLERNGKRPIFEQFANSNQAKYAKSIELKCTAIASPIMIQNFTSLTAIDICDLSMRYFNMTDFFNAFPATLTSFSAHFCEVKINELPSHSNNIEHLSLKCRTLYAKLAEAISNYFPKLNSLTLKGLVTESMNLNLPNNHFNDLTIEALHSGVDLIGFSVTDGNSSQPKHHIQCSTYPYDLLSVTVDKLQDRSIIDLKYTTTEELHISTRCFNS